MSGRPRKKSSNTERSMEELLAMVVELYSVPYDDRKGNRPEGLNSIRSVADTMGTSIWRIRKLLITAGYYSTSISREIQRRAVSGQTVEEIIAATGLKKASVYSYLPYKNLAYNLPETSVGADRQKLYRKRKKAIKELETHKRLPNAEDYLWNAIVLFEGYSFKTMKGLKFFYTVNRNRDGEQTGEIIFDRKEKGVTRATISLAYEKALEIEAAEGYVSGPKKLGVFGASYLYPIFLRFGMINPAP